MRILQAVVSMLSVAAVACGPRRDSTSTPTSSTAPVGVAGHAEPAMRPQVGDPLVLTVPLFDGRALPLDQLRGGVVVLALSATWVPGWDDNQQFFRSIVGDYGDALTVVTVAMDRDRSTLSRHWERDPLPFILGWDPQGALAAKLRVASLPAVVLVDAQGVVLATWAGFDADDREVLRTRVAGLLRPS